MVTKKPATALGEHPADAAVSQSTTTTHTAPMVPVSAPPAAVRLWSVDEISRLFAECERRGVRTFKGEGLEFAFATPNRRHESGGI